MSTLPVTVERYISGEGTIHPWIPYCFQPGICICIQLQLKLTLTRVSCWFLLQIIDVQSRRDLDLCCARLCLQRLVFMKVALRIEVASYGACLHNPHHPGSRITKLLRNGSVSDSPSPEKRQSDGLKVWISGLTRFSVSPSRMECFHVTELPHFTPLQQQTTHYLKSTMEVN